MRASMTSTRKHACQWVGTATRHLKSPPAIRFTRRDGTQTDTADDMFRELAETWTPIFNDPNIAALSWEDFALEFEQDLPPHIPVNLGVLDGDAYF